MQHMRRALSKGRPFTTLLSRLTETPCYSTLPSTGCSLGLSPGVSRGQRSVFERLEFRRGLFIQTQTTPNPSSMMFLPGQTVMEDGVREFTTPRDAMSSPLAKKLFTIEGVEMVFFGSDFITVSKSEAFSWRVLKPDIFAAMTEFFTSEEALFVDGAADPATTIQEDDDEVVAAIKEILETRIRPAVQDDGGDVIFQDFHEESGILTVKMVGACSGCPSSSATLKGGIENMLRHYIPEVKEVVEATNEAEETPLLTGLPSTNMSLHVALNGWSIQRIRRETPGCQKAIHFNNAGCALPPREVMRATEVFYRQEASYGGYESVERCASQERKAYGKLGELLCCQADEIAVVSSATAAWQQVLFGIDFHRGDTILTTPNEYGSNYINLLQLQVRKGVSLQVIPERPDGDLDYEMLEKMMALHKPKLLSLTHIPTSSGAVYDAVRVGEIAKEYEVLYLLDACQSVGQMNVDVQSIQCDFLSGTSRKFLRGPRGIGFLYAAQHTREIHEPAWLDVRSAVWEGKERYRAHLDATRYESYELNFAAKVGFGVAVEYCLALGIDWIEERIQFLASSFREGLQQNPKIQLHDHSPHLCGIVSFTVEGISAEAVCLFLREWKINVSVSRRPSTLLKFEQKSLEAIVRASLHYYNTLEELDTCLSALEQL